MRVKDKSIIVTGSGGGIGEGIAKRLAAEGAKVIVNDINTALGEKVVAEIKARRRHGILLRSRRDQVGRRQGAGRRSRAAPRQARRDGQQRRLDPPQPSSTGSERGRVRQVLCRQHEEHLPVDDSRRAGLSRQQGRQLHQHRLHRRRAAPPGPDLVQRLQGRGHHHQQVAGGRVRARQHPRELHQPGVQPRHRPVRGIRRRAGGRGPPRQIPAPPFRWAASRPPSTWPMRRSTWPATKPLSFQGSASRSMARRCV